MSAYHYSGWGYGDPEDADVYECWPVPNGRVAEWTPNPDRPGCGRLRVWWRDLCSECYTVAQLRQQKEAEMCIRMRPGYAENQLRMLGVDPHSIGSRFD